MSKSRDVAFNKTNESVVERGIHKPGQAQAGMGDRHDKVDRALRQRLQQLRASMGDEPQRGEKREPAPVPAATASPPQFEPVPMPALKARAPAPVRPRAARSKRRAVWLLSSLLLVGAAWYALNRGPANTTISATSLVAPTIPPAQAIIEPVKAGGPPLTGVAPSAKELPADATALAANTAPVLPAPVAGETPGTQLPPDPDEQLRRLVESWRQAWSNRDTERYLSFYGAAFVPGKGQSRIQWKASRYRNVGGKTDIKVQIRDLQVAPVNDREARITFLQDYTSGNYQESAQPKTLIVAREGEAWRIVKEWQADRSY